MLSEINQAEEDKYCTISHMESKKYNELVNMQKRSRLTGAENKLVVISGEKGKWGRVRLV